MSSPQTFNCVLCSKSFDDKETLQEHFRKHGDPAFHQNTKIKSKTQNEIPTSTEKIEENEMVGCDVCEEVFPTISKAITHKHKVHPDHDGKYFCPWCGKLFTMKHLYNKHIQSSHQGATSEDVNDFHCDCCNVDFFMPSAMMHHNKFFHRLDSEINNIGTSKKIKLYNEELVQIFYCPFCGEEYNNKVNLNKHMSDDHGDENQAPEDILRCPLCESVFYHLDAYELHLTFHSTEDLYSERNEMIKEIVEFSLDAVPPLLEKLPTLNEDMTVDNFLQMVIKQDSGDTEELGKIKSKKHKKHKKSKKSSITLDEFLNMNKDVFGDGLNVQGIEEVPTGSVLKKPKLKKVINTAHVKTSNLDLAKLKRQGIVIKTKSSQSSPTLVIPEKPLNTIDKTVKLEKNPLDTVTNPADIISKLMKQGVGDIKIVKKSNDILTDQDQSDKIDSSSDYNKSEVPYSPQANLDTRQCANNRTEQSDEKSQENVTNIDLKNEKHHDESITFGNHTNDEDIDETQNMTDNYEETFIDKQELKSLKEDELNNESLVNSDTEEIETTNNSFGKEQISENEQEIYSPGKGKEPTNICKDHLNNTLNSLNISKGITIKSLGQTSKSSECKDKNDQSTSPKTPIDVFKCLSKHITIKKPVKSKEYLPYEDDEGNNEECASKLEPADDSLEVANEIEKLQNQDNFKNNIHIKSNKYCMSPKHEVDNKTNDISNHLNILKKLRNVTAKPLTTLKQNVQLTSPVTSQSIKKSAPNDAIDKEIEIFNIDDSDSDPDGDHVINNKEGIVELKPVKQINLKDSDHLPKEMIQNLKRNINIKPSQKNMTSPNPQSSDGQQEYKTTINRMTETKSIIKTNQNRLHKQTQLQKTLQNLSQHITIKSNISSPPPNFDDHSDMDNEEMEHHNSDDGNESDSSTGKVKISELHEEEADNDHENFDENEMNATVQSPEDYNKDEEDHWDESDEFTDFEDQIKTNPIKIGNTNSNQTIKQRPPHNIGSLNKELTIKSLRQTNPSPQVETATEDEAFEASQNSRNISIKPNPVKIMNKNMTQPSHSFTDQKTTSSTNQVNTVKTLKTYKSQTFIEEVTTTVTKTIRTVNTNESHNAIQKVRPQKIMNTGNNIRGTGRIRPHGHVVGTKIKKINPQVRPQVIRPSNQMVAIRPRLANPQSFNIRKPTPVQQNMPRLTNLNKVNNSQSSQSLKRPIESKEEETDQTAIFKKPKPVTIAQKSQFNSESVQYSCSSQSKSNFSSVKVVKGNSVATSQVRSESCVNQQHLSKLSGVSGLKIVKSSSKQMSQVENKCQVNSPKNSAIAALEKLQSQGLLVKKPRFEPTDNVAEADFFSGSDDEHFEDEHFDE
ncbi:uncharacterized protein PF3D7_1120000-like [Leptidea sinapis]|uniref:uncharacterized protein PF3D7_1120000-like n=1 Tax=Leptidea sinapis TaxID=189913 RepID=UPI00213E16DA|nr:uncharacterized protein PF3D7_1120000-like [Leptidea sinapis]